MMLLLILLSRKSQRMPVLLVFDIQALLNQGVLVRLIIMVLFICKYLIFLSMISNTPPNTTSFAPIKYHGNHLFHARQYLSPISLHFGIHVTEAPEKTSPWTQKSPLALSCCCLISPRWSCPDQLCSSHSTYRDNTWPQSRAFYTGIKSTDNIVKI